MHKSNSNNCFTSFLLLISVISFFSCTQHKEQERPMTFAPKVVAANGYVVPKDSMAKPTVILVDESKLKKIPVGTPKVVLTNTNIHPAGKPKIILAGTPRVCTPGQDTFLLAKTVPAIDSPFVAGIPEVVIAKDAYIRDQNPENFSSFGKLQGLKHGNINCMLEDKSGNLWFGTQGGGVSKYDGKSFTHFTDKEGLSHNFVFSMLEDKSGNLWFGTWGGGVSKYDGKSFTHFTDKEGLSNNVVRSMLEDKSGNLWFGTWGGGVSKYDGKSFTHFTDKEGLSNNDVRSMLEDKSGNLWFGTWGGGVSKYNGKSFTHFTDKEGLSNNAVVSMLEDKSGNLWFGTQGGGVSKLALSKVEGSTQYTFTHFTDKEGLNNNNVVSMLEDKSGNLWFGTNGGGVSKYDGKSFTHFTDKEGLSNNSVFSMLEDKSGNLWFGTWGGGVSKLALSEVEGSSQYTFTHFTEKEGLSNNVVLSMLEDKNGNLWLGTRFGLSKLSPKDKEKLVFFSDPDSYRDKSAPEAEGKVFFKNYTYEDGFLGIGCNGSAILEAKDGTIWIGANDRLTAYHPPVGGEIADTLAPTIQLTGIALFNENIAWVNLTSSVSQGLEPSSKEKGSGNNFSVKDTNIVLGNGVSVGSFEFDGLSRWYNLPENLSLAYNNNYLTFNFIGITQKQPKKVKYQYKLEGIDENWSALTNRTEAPYGNLPQGTYTFKVKAMNSEGYWSEEFSYSFTIRPPWWKTWWMYCLYALLVGGSIWWTVKFRSKALRRENLILEEKVKHRTNQLQTSLDDLKSTQTQLIQSEKMASLGELTAGIAHEIQNPLNFVNNFSEVSSELIDEMNADLDNGDYAEAKIIAADVKQNLEKINHHGKRADSIVKGMLQHSRSSNGVKEPTDLNALCDEYLRLSYHGLRAKDKSFNAIIKTDFDDSIGKINIIPQDFGRVVLNLLTNAFYACAERSRSAVDEKNKSPLTPKGGTYEPTVSISTKKIGFAIEIQVADNGNGIPDNAIDKIFQPFFTTKPTGQGTGLGLSMSYDIITKGHGGELKVATQDGEGTTFTITI